MSKYHVKINGDTGRCTASEGKCPFTAEGAEHFSSLTEAHVHAESVLAKMEGGVLASARHSLKKANDGFNNENFAAYRGKEVAPEDLDSHSKTEETFPAKRKSITTNGGKVLLWRLGPLSYNTQERWTRAPNSRGMWAFPYPYFELSFAAHQYDYLMPKRLQKNGHYPLLSTDYLYKGEPLPLHSVIPPLDADGLLPKDYKVREGFWDDRDKWVKTVGRKILPFRKFWYEGDLYSHISPKGEVGDVGLRSPETASWYRMYARTFATAATKVGLDRYYPSWKDRDRWRREGKPGRKVTGRHETIWRFSWRMVRAASHQSVD